MRNILLPAAAWLAFAGTPALAQCRFPSDGSARTLTYTFEPSIANTGAVLHITLRFRGGPAAQEEIEVPYEWAGETLHGFTNLRALSADTVIADSSSPERRLLRHAPNQDVALAWDMVKDWTGRFMPPAQFHGVIQPEYVEINGDNALVHPKLSPQERVSVHFDWTKLPAAWTLATSFGASTHPDDRCQSYSGPWSAVQQALFAAGEFRIRHFRIGVRPAVLAIYGQWTFSDDEAITAIQKTVGIVRDFWRDDNFPYFLVTLKPFDNDSGQGDGSAFTNAFWLYLSRRDPVPALLLIHETFHEWDPLRMGNAADGSSIKWFSEGFVRYYSNVLAYRARLIPLSAYLESVNRDLRDFPNAAGDPERGPVIALWLDQQIRRDSNGKNSLDNVMRDMVREASQPLTQARILATAGRYLSPISRSALAQLIQPGSRIPALDTAPGPCVWGQVEEVATFSLGFDLAASRATGALTGVDPVGPAFQAGLRNGQRLSGRLSVHNGQPDKAVIVTVQTDEGRQAIEYYPRGAPVKVMQYHLDPKADIANPAGCQIQ